MSACSVWTLDAVDALHRLEQGGGTRAVGGVSRPHGDAPWKVTVGYNQQRPAWTSFSKPPGQAEVRRRDSSCSPSYVPCSTPPLKDWSPSVREAEFAYMTALPDAA